MACPENKNPVQLFNMKTDPYEKVNVYQRHPEVVKNLFAIYVQMVKD